MQPGHPPAPRPPVRPSKLWFLLAALLAIGGVALAGGLALSGVRTVQDRVAGFQRITVPGTGAVTLEVGDYTVYHEFPGAADGGGRADSDTVQVGITDPVGNPADLRPYAATVTYGLAGREGVAAYSFRADRAGVYSVQARGSRSTVAVGTGLGSTLGSALGGAFASGFGGVLIGVIVAVVVGVRRMRHRRRLDAAARGFGGPGGYPAHPPPPGYGAARPGPGAAPPGYRGAGRRPPY